MGYPNYEDGGLAVGHREDSCSVEAPPGEARA